MIRPENAAANERRPMRISEFQREIERIYFERDKARGLGGTFMWFIEEVGELATAIRDRDKTAKAEMEGEFADVYAWLVSLASICGIEMEDVVRKYANGCPACDQTPCECSEKG